MAGKREWRTNGNLHVVLPGWVRRSTAERKLPELAADPNIRGACIVQLPNGAYTIAAQAIRIGRQWYEFSENGPRMRIDR